MNDLDKKLRGLLRIVFSRTTIIIVSLLLQFLTFIFTIQWLSEYSTLIYYSFLFLGLLVITHIMNTNTNASFKIAWIIPVLVIPVFGAIFYIFMYNQFETKSMKKQLDSLDEKLNSVLKQDEDIMIELTHKAEGEFGLAKYLNNVGSFPIYKDCNVEFFPLGEYKYDEMIKQLKAAEKFIFMEYFIVAEGQMWESILEILKEKAASGVEVRFMYDGMCSLVLLPYGYYKDLQKFGIQSIPFSQIRPALSSYQNNRDHRKILVVDGKVAFTGGINLADEYINKIERFGHWKDTAVMVQGEAVKTFTLMFLKMWNVANGIENINKEDIEKYINCTTQCKIEPKALYKELEYGGYVVPYCDDPFSDERVGKQVYIDILNRASNYVHIMTPYLIIDDEMEMALSYCAKRGVETVIIMPHIPDKIYAYLLARTYYKDLLESGVKIYEYTPGFVHAKLFVSDDIRGVVGTSNLDFRSLYLHFECCMYIYENTVINNIERDYKHTLEMCQQITVDDCKNYPLYKKVAGHLLRFIAPLM